MQDVTTINRHSLPIEILVSRRKQNRIPHVPVVTWSSRRNLQNVSEEKAAASIIQLPFHISPLAIRSSDPIRYRLQSSHLETHLVLWS